MPIPYEPNMNAAFSANPRLLDYALENNVIIVFPATLLALLKVISYGWMQVSLAENAKKVADQGKEVFDRVTTFVGHLSKIGSSLKRSVDNYNKAMSSLESRVLPSTKRLKELGVVGMNN